MINEDNRTKIQKYVLPQSYESGYQMVIPLHTVTGEAGNLTVLYLSYNTVTFSSTSTVISSAGELSLGLMLADKLVTLVTFRSLGDNRRIGIFLQDDDPLHLALAL